MADIFFSEIEGRVSLFSQSDTVNMYAPISTNFTSPSTVPSTIFFIKVRERMVEIEEYLETRQAPQREKGKK